MRALAFTNAIALDTDYQLCDAHMYVHSRSLALGTDYQDLDYRKLARNHTDDRWPEWIWQGSASLGSTAQVFAGELGGGG